MILKQIIFILPLTFGYCYAQNLDTILLNGVYQGKDLYVQNPFSESQIGKCIEKILVNGQETNLEEGFIVDLTQSKMGSPLQIFILHEKGCTPKLLNNNVILPQSTFQIESISLDSMGNLKWISKNETGLLVYAIEQFKWNRWVEIDKVKEQGTDKNHYHRKVKLTSGKNIVRLKQTDNDSIPRYSDTLEVITSKPPVKLESHKIKKNIKFSQETPYELFDSHGDLVKKGMGNTVDCINLKKGDYYLNYDRSTVSIKKVN
ncbi:MAG: hypothetical protein MRY83_14110 [Flavobacteriales bacterium]|nr:hypothetical protein [Flavobacteriales bacterium]